MAVTSDEGVTRRYGGGGREVMVMEKVSLDDRTRAEAEAKLVDVMLWKKWKVEVGSDGADLCSGSDFGFCY